ncbi:unnamed protein product [Microthlaspi erraticum]|uniref:Uncharacterized protein n=1 Tax=Microthlaspi erraticum TaxID=1685480 RepID=A0A6D2JGH7_9BRAS|nr:unnamed protein product [Microthlaspi erraticum]
MYIWAKSVGFSSCRKRKVSHEPPSSPRRVWADIVPRKAPNISQASSLSIKAFGAAARAIRHSKSSMGFVYSLTGHVSVENKFRPIVDPNGFIPLRRDA